MHRRSGSTGLLACLAAFAVAAAGCGSDSNQAELRAANPISITAYITNDEVRVQPKTFGAGPVNFSISNQSTKAVSFTLQGPVNSSSNPIPAGGTGNLKVDLEAGDYQVTGGSRSAANPQVLAVGPERESAQDDLLLP